MSSDRFTEDCLACLASEGTACPLAALAQVRVFMAQLDNIATLEIHNQTLLASVMEPSGFSTKMGPWTILNPSDNTRQTLSLSVGFPRPETPVPGSTLWPPQPSLSRRSRILYAGLVCQESPKRKPYGSNPCRNLKALRVNGYRVIDVIETNGHPYSVTPLDCLPSPSCWAWSMRHTPASAHSWSGGSPDFRQGSG